MKIHRLQFSIDIEAERSAIWQALWEDSSYREWTAVFAEGSHAVTDHWKEGSKVLFLAPDRSGIYSIVERHVPNEVMKFRHLGLVTAGQEQPLDDTTRQWSGTTESYTLTEGEQGTTLAVEIDVLDEHLDFMKDTFPRALKKVARLSVRR
ncbi:hypothetical protein GGR26_000066 [Lewinella marina]|uniref:ATPase n=1 Tax=Neolewinella marina TaxID=438751 RepID=A0A2G0CKK7_9BACT|nr:hypothetical protein [Neolewinella marina]NJB84321.1 hypothetical protein [Neolewinella marina]PHL00478.1 hypothetical protein CGL56_05455 [Neolewinella marina]